MERQNAELLRRMQEIESTRINESQKSAQTAFEKFRQDFPDEAAALEARTTPLELSQRRAQQDIENLRTQ